MPKVRLLPVMLVGGIAAVVVASSAIAGGRSAPISIHSPVGFGQKKDVGGGAGSAQGQETGEKAEDGQGSDKVAQAIADEFGVSKEEVLARHQQGIGFGALFKLYKLARAKGMSVDDLLATIPTSANGEREFGFGNLRKSLTAEQRAAFESGPKNLGQLVSGKSKHKKPHAEGADEGNKNAEPTNSSGPHSARAS